MAKARSKDLAMRFYPINTLIKGILLTTRDTVTASCSTATEVRKIRMSSMKGSGSKDSSMERGIRLKPIFSIWGISKGVFKLESVKSRPKQLIIKDKLKKASSKERVIKF